MRERKYLFELIDFIKKQTGLTQQQISKQAKYDEDTLASAKARKDGHRPVIEQLQIVFADVLEGTEFQRPIDPVVFQVVNKKQGEDYMMRYTELLEKYTLLQEKMDKLQNTVDSNSNSILLNLEALLLRLIAFQGVTLESLSRQEKMKDGQGLVREMGKRLGLAIEQRQKDRSSLKDTQHSF